MWQAILVLIGIVIAISLFLNFIGLSSLIVYFIGAGILLAIWFFFFR